MPKNALQDKRFTYWNTQDGMYQLGCFGFSFKDGDLRAELQPVNAVDRSHVWSADITRDGAVLVTLGADDPYRLAEKVLAVAEDLS